MPASGLCLVYEDGDFAAEEVVAMRLAAECTVQAGYLRPDAFLQLVYCALTAHYRSAYTSSAIEQYPMMVAKLAGAANTCTREAGTSRCASRCA